MGEIKYGLVTEVSRNHSDINAKIFIHICMVKGNGHGYQTCPVTAGQSHKKSQDSGRSSK